MFNQALMITVAGMGGVFIFLGLLIICINYMHHFLKTNQPKEKTKLAIAIAMAKHQE